MVYCSACAADHPRKQSANAAVKDFLMCMIDLLVLNGKFDGRNGRAPPPERIVSEEVSVLASSGTGRPAAG